MKKNKIELSEKQVKAIELLAFEGLTQKETATAIGVHENTVSNWRKNPEFIAEIDRALRQVISAASVRALAAMIGLLNAKSESIKFAAARDLLDRAGYKQSEKIEVAEERSRQLGQLDSILQQLKGES